MVELPETVLFLRQGNKRISRTQLLASLTKEGSLLLNHFYQRCQILGKLQKKGADISLSAGK
jgi:hypothetical protein